MVGDNISVILNVYKRPKTLEQQIERILDQSIKINPKNIHVWYNKSDMEQFLPINKEIKTYKINWNTKFWGRFTIPLMLECEYIALFDDDMLPEKDWIKNCLDSMNEKEGIYGGSGIRLKTNKYKPNQKVGWNGLHSSNIEKVDLVGHAWFFKQEWTKYLYYEKPFDRENGEDIMFSYLSQKYGGINTYVPPHPDDNKSMWSTDYEFAAKTGSDDVAHSIANISNHYKQRDMICELAVKNGWKRVLE